MFSPCPGANSGHSGDLLSDVNVLSDLTVDATDSAAVARPLRRPANQRWAYENRQSACKGGDTVSVLPKRLSKPPQRLKTSRLGMIVCVPVEPAFLFSLADFHPAATHFSSLSSTSIPPTVGAVLPALESDSNRHNPHDRRDPSGLPSMYVLRLDLSLLMVGSLRPFIQFPMMCLSPFSVMTLRLFLRFPTYTFLLGSRGLMTS